MANVRRAEFSWTPGLAREFARQTTQLVGIVAKMHCKDGRTTLQRACAQCTRSVQEVHGPQVQMCVILRQLISACWVQIAAFPGPMPLAVYRC